MRRFIGLRDAPALVWAVLRLALSMRSADRAECLALTGWSPLHSLAVSVWRSAEVWSVEIGGDLVALWGVARDREGTGLAWALTARAADRHKRLMWVASRAALDEVFERWSVIGNAIDDRHSVALSWGRRLGFRFADPIKVMGQEFLPFTLTKEDLPWVSWRSPQS